MSLVFHALWPMGLALLLGLALGRLWPGLVAWTARPMQLLILLLLFYCGREFSDILQVGPALGQILQASALYALLTTAASWLLITAFRRHAHSAAERAHAAQAARPWRRALFDCVLALGTVSLGVVVGHEGAAVLDLLSTRALIVLMVLLIGIDLVAVPLTGVWRSRQAWAIPGLVIVGSALGGLAAAQWLGEPNRTALAIAAGFGWVTLSSLLVSGGLGDTYGAMAMTTDIFRELLAITALYLLGARSRLESVGICGATALDATLPLIRTQCGQATVPLALLSGLVLTLASPLLILLSLNLPG